MEVAKTKDPVLKQALDWSEAVNATIADMVKGVPPFPFVRESLDKIYRQADIIICSGTPNEALKREWEEHDLTQYVRVIAGQEQGSKEEHLMLVKEKYPTGHILMIGDAPGDIKAAHANELLFYPINLGEERKSWEKFFNEYSKLFLVGKYLKDIEHKLIVEFESYLPDLPPWKK